MIDWDRSRPGAAVVLDPGAQQLLDPRGDRQFEPPPDFCEIFVLLSWAGPERDTGQVAVRAGDHRVGVLAVADSSAFESFLEQGSQCQLRTPRSMVTCGGRSSQGILDARRG